jgi:hypothetical protein
MIFFKRLNPCSDKTGTQHDDGFALCQPGQ